MSSSISDRWVIIAALAAAPALAAPSGVRAQSWAASTPGLWNDPTNWSPQSVPNAVGASAEIFSTVEGGPLSAGGTFTFNTPVTLGSLNIQMGFAGPSVTLAPQQLIFDNGAGADVFLDGDGSLAINITGPILLRGDLVSTWTASNGALTGTISGDFGIRHEPPFSARLRLWGNNTYTGETRTTSGRLSILTAAGLGAHTTGTFIEDQGVLIMENGSVPTITGEPVSLVDGGRLWMRQADWAEEITLVNAGEIAPWFDSVETTVSAKLTGTATFIRGTAQSRFTTDPTKESVLTVSNLANDYTNGTIIRSGVLSIPGDGALGVPGTAISFDVSGFSEGPPALATTADTTIPRDISLLDDGWLRAVAGTTATYNGVISGSRALSIGFLDWTGAVAISGDNTYTGGTAVLTGTLAVTNATGSATGSGGVAVGEPAVLAGDGAIAGAVDMLAGGFLTPGAPTGALGVGALTLGPTTETFIEIDGDALGEFDQIQVAGATALDGDLFVIAVEGLPQPGDEFIILTASSVSGTFATTTLPDGFGIVYEADRVILTFSGSDPCPADLDGTNEVDGADLGQLLLAWSPTAGSAFGSPADLNGDGKVDGADLGLLLLGWGLCP